MPFTAGWTAKIGYRRIQAELKAVFLSLPERSRFNRRRRNLSRVSEAISVDSFLILVCDFKRAKETSTSDFKWADGTGTSVTYGHCATKSLGTLFGFRGSLITTANGVRVDFAIVLGDKGYVSEHLQADLLATEGPVLLPTLRSDQKQQYPERFRKLQVRMRRRMETTIGQLTEPFPISRVRALKH